MSAELYGNTACGITQSGSSGSYTYTTTRNPNYPVNDVTWGDAARFCNWLTNNQPTGAEVNGTTETGSYTLNGATSDAALLAVTRNANADYVIPTENEWYKAAYYNPTNSSYYLYPTQSNSQPSNVLSATETNNALHRPDELPDGGRRFCRFFQPIRHIRSRRRRNSVERVGLRRFESRVSGRVGQRRRPRLAVRQHWLRLPE